MLGTSFRAILKSSVLEKLKHSRHQRVWLAEHHARVPAVMRAQKSGVIGNFSSAGARRGFAGVRLYAAAKWAVSGLSECLTYEVADFGIKVCCIEPAYFHSNLLNPGKCNSKIKLLTEWKEVSVSTNHNWSNKHYYKATHTCITWVSQ